MTCLLAGLADPAIKEWLPALTVTDGAIELDAARSSCCGGTGARWTSATNTTLTCDLRGRLAAVRRLGGRYYATWGQDGVGLRAALQSPVAQVALHRLAAIAAGTNAKGLAYFAGGPKARQPSVWSLAASAAWRFGLDAHVVTLDRGKGSVVLPQILPSAQRRTVLFVENAQRLWHSPVAEELERLVAFAYGALIPLWVEFRVTAPGLSDPERPGGTALNVKRALTQRVADAKRREPLAWVAPEIRSKFRAVADGAPGVAPPDAPRRGTARAAPLRLPWDH